MIYVKPYVRKMNGKIIHVRGYDRKQKVGEQKFNEKEFTKVELSDAEIAMEEINEYQGNNLWQDVVLGYSIDQERQKREDSEGSNHIFFNDGSVLTWIGSEDKWEVDDWY